MEGSNSIGALELAGSRTDRFETGDSIYSSYNGDKCPPSPAKESRTSKASKRIDMLRLAQLAREVNLLDFSRKLEHCCTDFLVLVDDTGKYSITPMRCGHKLCPLCHAYHAYKIRLRLEEIVYRAKSMITLTMRTVNDHEISEYLRILRRAFRLMSQRKKKDQWIPFEPGYFWRLEITEGQGFHPHLHVLSTHEWIHYDRLRKRWSQCVKTAGGSGDHIWISKTDRNTPREVAKYLSKDIDFFDPNRWSFLLNGLKGVRCFGSGRALKLPKLESCGKRFYTFGCKIDIFEGEKFLEQIANCSPGSKIRPDSKLQAKWRDRATIEEYFGI